MIITSHMQTIIQIHPCLLKLSRKQESVTDGHYNYIPHCYCRGIITITPCLVHLAWAGFKLAPSVVIGIDCKDSYKSNYHMVMTMTAPQLLKIMNIDQYKKNT
jgi:hypothetical protein